MNIKSINVGMGETKLSKLASEQLVAPGLGSCIGLTMYDPEKKIAGMAHIVLPDSNLASGEITLAGKYADTGIPDLLENMLKLGASKDKIITAISGGAQMFNIEKGSNILNVGMRNTIAVKAFLAEARLPLKAEDTGGNKGRTMRIEVATGTVYVRSIGSQETIIGEQIKCQKS